MKRLAIIFALLATLLLGGCGGGPGRSLVSILPTTSPTPPPSAPPTTPPTAPPTTNPPAPPTPNIAGNWQFSATSSTPGARPFSIAGGISQADTTASGTLHIDNPTCFDPLISRSLAGTLSPDTTSLVVTGSDGQMVTLSGSFTNFTYNVMVDGTIFTTFTGTYKVDGGCAAGDHGTVTGAYVYSIGPEYDPFPWSGTFTNSSTQQMLHATGTIVESTNADAAGSFGIGGGATFDNACLSAGTMKTGMYPSASFILGTSVTIEFDTSSGILNFVGTLDQDTNEISGNYSITGSSCDQSGSAVISIATGCPGCWDY